jgi:hypothetical protein
LVTSRSGARAACEKDLPLNIAAVYADQPTRSLATGVLRNLARNCAPVCEIHSEWWSFESLDAAAEREVAACAAADADMIWCATHACEGLPESVRTWAGLWSSYRGEGNRALVVLLRGPSAYRIEQSPSWTYLCWLAERAGTMLFAHRFECDCRRRAELPSPPSLMSGRFPHSNEKLIPAGCSR